MEKTEETKKKACLAVYCNGWKECDDCLGEWCKWHPEYDGKTVEEVLDRESGDSIEDIIAAIEKVDWVGPSRISMIPEFYQFIMCKNIEPLLEKIKEAKEKGEKLKMWWYE